MKKSSYQELIFFDLFLFLAFQTRVFFLDCEHAVLHFIHNLLDLHLQECLRVPVLHKTMVEWPICYQGENELVGVGVVPHLDFGLPLELLLNRQSSNCLESVWLFPELSRFLLGHHHQVVCQFHRSELLDEVHEVNSKSQAPVALLNHNVF